MYATVERQKKIRNWYYDCTCGKSKLLKCLVSSSIFISRLLDPIFGSQSGPRTKIMTSSGGTFLGEKIHK